jgi:RNA polymerase primary sigma factor
VPNRTALSQDTSKLIHFDSSITATPHQLLSGQSYTSDALEQYVKDIRDIPLLTKEEEILLAQQIEAGRQAQQRLEQTPTLDPQHKVMLESFIMDAEAAKEHLIEANLRLVISVAKQLRPLAKKLSLLDLIQEGNRGLIQAAEKFDYRRGYKFSTNAVWWIRHTMLRAIENTARTVRLPVHITSKVRQLSHVYVTLQQELKRTPSSSELAERLGQDWNEAKVETLLLRLRQPLSLELPLSEDGETLLGTLIEDNSIPSPDACATQIALDEELHTVLAQLPKREAVILEHHYGLFNEEQQSLQEIGDALGLTRERIRQLEKRALNKLRQSRYVQEHLRDFSEGGLP